MHPSSALSSSNRRNLMLREITLLTSVMNPAALQPRATLCQYVNIVNILQIRQCQFKNLRSLISITKNTYDFVWKLIVLPTTMQGLAGLKQYYQNQELARGLRCLTFLGLIQLSRNCNFLVSANPHRRRGTFLTTRLLDQSQVPWLHYST